MAGHSHIDLPDDNSKVPHSRARRGTGHAKNSRYRLDRAICRNAELSSLPTERTAASTSRTREKVGRAAASPDCATAMDRNRPTSGTQALVLCRPGTRY